jgi:hypothetical protein
MMDNAAKLIDDLLAEVKRIKEIEALSAIVSDELLDRVNHSTGRLIVSQDLYFSAMRLHALTRNALPEAPEGEAK